MPAPVLKLLLYLSLPVILLLGGAAASCAQDPRSPDDDCRPFAGVERPAFDTAGWATDFCKHSVPYEEIISGGPPRDGIPPIDEPRFVPVSEADDWLAPNEPILFFEREGDARAYPLQIITWHEIVNDEVGGLPVVVTFCPLCNAALVFVRPVVDGQRLTFGTSGNLRHSDLIMWDRQTESWWQQFTGEGIVGELTGQRLEMLPSSIISWQTYKEEHPEGRVLSRETGIDRPYGRNPYAGYDDVSQSPFLYKGPVGERLPPMARVVGVAHEGQARAYSLDLLREEQVIHDTLGGVAVVVFWREGTASALDSRRIAEGRDVGATGVFKSAVNGRELLFTARPDGAFIDGETGSTWNIMGEATAGPLAGTRLEQLVHHDIFWFVWSAFQPEGRLFDP
jgi:hypothetical protein